MNAYSISLFDRMIRIDNELRAVGRFVSSSVGSVHSIDELVHDAFAEIFKSVGIFTENDGYMVLYGEADRALFETVITEERIAGVKPFIITATQDSETQFFFGVNFSHSQMESFTVVGNVRQEYLWGIGPKPLLPAMTELTVYDIIGEQIVASENGPKGSLEELELTQTAKDLHVFQFQHDGETYFAAFSNLFVESRFQRVGWTIIISRSRNDIMSAMDNFKATFPFITLLFLLLVVYLSVLFIRKGLDPLERLKQGTQRVANKDFSTQVDIRSGDEFEELGNSFNEMALKLDKQFNALTVLGEIDRAILSSLDRKKIVARTLQRMKEFFHCELSVFVKISNASIAHVKVYSMEGRRLDDPLYSYFALSDENRRVFFVEKDSFVVCPEDQGHDFLKTITDKEDLEYLCLPLRVEGNVNRLLLLGKKAGSFHKDEEISQARQIANQLAIGLANSLSLEKLDRLAKGTIEALARTVDAKSKWTSGHSERVAELSSRIARAMGLPGKDIEALQRGGLLHDIGKIGIPLAILDKPDRLTDQEYGEIKNHPSIGAKILEPIEAYQDIIPLVAQHHERYDGTGYPAGLKGGEISLGARIMAVADVWDALVSERPYREGWIQERARDLIVKSSGSHFDPDVVNVFLAVTAEE
ncbi:MAG: HD domain-containing phosphohydrolase [Desulfopila sp.]|nr:HD domain-containing phosphohydrolase [Desulfopila sp.]